jgi:hypothetical protein
VTGATPDNRIIARAGREILRPMGLTQKGRSRVWLDDRSWWLGVVEFQPSAWDRGSFLNVGVMWLWKPGDAHTVYFGLSHRIEGFVAFESEQQFEPEARRLATRAAEEIERYRSELSDIAAAAAILRREASEKPGWPAWYAAVALALAGDTVEAARHFRRVAESDDDRDWWRPIKAIAARLEDAVRAAPAAVEREAIGWIESYRRSLRLPPFDPASLSRE